MQINLWWLAGNGLWILGVAIALATLGFARERQIRIDRAWRSGLWVYQAGQALTLLGLLLAQAGWRPVALACLWILWAGLDGYWNGKDPKKL